MFPQPFSWQHQQENVNNERNENGVVEIPEASHKRKHAIDDDGEISQDAEDISNFCDSSRQRIHLHPNPQVYEKAKAVTSLLTFSRDQLKTKSGENGCSRAEEASTLNKIEVALRHKHMGPLPSSEAQSKPAELRSTSWQPKEVDPRVADKVMKTYTRMISAKQDGDSLANHRIKMQEYQDKVNAKKDETRAACNELSRNNKEACLSAVRDTTDMDKLERIRSRASSTRTGEAQDIIHQVGKFHDKYVSVLGSCLTHESPKKESCVRLTNEAFNKGSKKLQFMIGAGFSPAKIESVANAQKDTLQAIEEAHASD